MKRTLCILTVLMLSVWHISHAQIFNNSQIPESINDDGAAPDASAILDIQSADKGVLVPRMTTTQRTAIATPATGLLVFDTTTGGFWFFDGTAWADLSAGGADTDWTENANGIYHNTGNVAINTTNIDPNSNLYVYRPSGDYGPDKASIFGYRFGYSGAADSGGVSASYTGIDAAIKGYSNWGNSYSAAVAGYGVLDYINSAAVIGGRSSGSSFGALGFRDSTQIWAGYFDGDVRFRPASSYSPELYLDIVREYVNQGEFGRWHELYVIPNGRNVNAPDYDFYYLGNNNNHFDGLYCNAINPENNLIINGTTVVSGDNNLGVGTSLPGMKLHVKQDIANRGIRTEHHTATDYWDTGVGLTTKNYKFYYNGLSRADIASTDGAYTQLSDRSLKMDIEYLENVLPGVLKLKPAKYYYVDSKAEAKAKSHGFIAQEVGAVFPELVRQREDGKIALAYDDFAVLAVKAIQEQQAVIDAQAKKIAAMESQSKKIAALEAALNEVKALLEKQ